MKVRSFIVLLVLGMMLALGHGGGAVANTSAGELNTKMDQLNNLQDKMENARKQLSKYNKEEKNTLVALQKAEDKLEDLQQRIASTDRKLKNAESQLAVATKDLTSAETKLADTMKDYERAMGSLEGRLVQLYKMGPGTYVELLLGAESFADFVTRYDFIKLIIKQNGSDFVELRASKETLEEQKADIAARKSSLEQQRREISKLSSNLATEKRQAESAMTERSYYLQRVQRERAKWQKELEEEERQSRELERTIREMQERLGKSGKLPAWTGKFIWPVQGRISSAYGWRIHPIFKDRRFHSGIDIAAKSGTPVKAAASGQVLLAGWINGYGYTVILDHGGGLSTLYGHNSSVNTSAGKAVLQGDIICKVGSTGFATGPHLHFEVRLKGTTEDPMKRLPK